MFGRTAAQLVREVNNDDQHIRRFNVRMWASFCWNFFSLLEMGCSECVLGF
jgi:hypothetical protein